MLEFSPRNWLDGSCPDTDTAVLMNLRHRVVKTREDNAQRITLHRKCGFAAQVLVAATSVSEGEARPHDGGRKTEMSKRAVATAGRGHDGIRDSTLQLVCYRQCGAEGSVRAP